MWDRCIRPPGSGGPPGTSDSFGEGMSVFAPPHEDLEHEQEKSAGERAWIWDSTPPLQTLALPSPATSFDASCSAYLSLSLPSCENGCDHSNQAERMKS